jgi:hypothetical protein
VKLDNDKEKQWHIDSEVDQKDPAHCLGQVGTNVAAGVLGQAVDLQALGAIPLASHFPRVVNEERRIS